MSEHWFAGIFRTTSLVVLLVAIALLSAVATMQFAIHGAEVRVPALKGMTVAEAHSLTAGMGLGLNVDNRYYSAEVAAGHILSQSPTPGAVVRREYRVRVAESLGPQRVDVPNTIGLDEQFAALELRRAGLDVNAVARLPLAGIRPGTVLAQDPPAHAQGIERPSVSLLVATPDTNAPDGFVMPSLVGLPVARAQAELARLGLRSAPPDLVDAGAAPPADGAKAVSAPPPAADGIHPPPGQTAAPGTVLPGTVLFERPQAGTRVDPGTEVHLGVAR